VRGLISSCRALIIVTWLFYPVAYLLRADALPGAIPGIIPEQSGLGLVGTQVGYAIADIAAKAGFGFVIYLIARGKTEALTDEERAEQSRAALMTA
jgi:bacteriorhodopsin